MKLKIIVATAATVVSSAFAGAGQLHAAPSAHSIMLSAAEMPKGSTSFKIDHQSGSSVMDFVRGLKVTPSVCGTLLKTALTKNKAVNVTVETSELKGIQYAEIYSPGPIKFSMPEVLKASRSCNHIEAQDNLRHVKADIAPHSGAYFSQPHPYEFHVTGKNLGLGRDAVASVNVLAGGTMTSHGLIGVAAIAKNGARPNEAMFQKLFQKAVQKALRA